METVSVTNATTGKALQVSDSIAYWDGGHKFPKIFLSRDQKLVATPHLDGSVKIWDPYSGKLLSRLFIQDYFPEGVYITDNNKFVITLSQNELPVIWNLTTQKPLEIVSQEFINDRFYKIEKCDTKSDLYFAIADAGSIIQFDLNGKLYKTLKSKALTDPFIAQANVGYLKTCDDNITKVRDIKDGKVRISNKDGNACGWMTDNDLVTMNDTSYNIWGLSSGKCLANILKNGLVALHSGPKLLSIRFTGGYKYEIWDETKKTLISDVTPDLKIKQDFTNIQVLECMLSENQELVVTQTRVREFKDSSMSVIASDFVVISAFSLKENRIIREFVRNASDKYFSAWESTTWHSPKLSNDGKYLVICSPEGKIEVYNTQTIKLAFERTFDQFSYPVDITSDIRTLSIKTSRSVILINLATAELAGSIEPKGVLTIGKAFVSGDGSSALVETYGVDTSSLILYDVCTNHVISQLSAVSQIYSVSFKNDLLIFSHQGGYVFYRLSTGKNLLTLYELGDDWAVITPDGLFDASPGAMEMMYYVQGVDIIEFDQLKDKYWEPGLYEKVMNGAAIREVEFIDRKLDLWPEITDLLFRDNYEKLQISLEDQGGGFGRVQVFLNEKEIEADARGNNFKAAGKSASITISLKNHPLLINGENRVEAVTWNSAGTLSGKRESAEFLVEKASYKPSAFIIAIGISDYTGEKIDLKFAAKDAVDFLTAAKIGARNLFSEERTHTWLLNTQTGNTLQPDKPTIIKSFGEIAAMAKPGDVVVVYLSGHGINVGGEEGDLHFLTKEAFSPNPDIYKDPGVKDKCTISGDELIKLLNEIPATKQVLIIDACSSGKVVENLVAKRDIESSIIKALERMKDRAGLHIITGSAADAVSYEATKFGQGLLTYSILAGMRGLALKDNKTVDVAMLMQHAREMVPKLAEGIGGIQEPKIFTPKGAESFDIGIITDKEKSMIPLAKAKQIFISSTFQEVNELSDVLNLGDLVDEMLTNKSAEEKNSPIVFWAVTSYPEVYKISGSYTINDDKIEVQFKLVKDKTGGETIKLTGLGSKISELINEIIKRALQNM